MAYRRWTYAVLFVCCLPFNAADINKGPSFQDNDHCKGILDNFRSSIAAFDECERRDPPQNEQSAFCVSCSSSYWDVTRVYENITKMGDKKCKKELDNTHESERYQSIQKTWENAKCDSEFCLNILTDIGYSLAAIEECESRNPPKDEQSTFCVSCSSSYMNVTQVYKNITKLVKKTCEKALANNNDYNRNLNYYSTIQETWDNAKCESDLCLYILTDFGYSLAAIEECESRNPPKDEQSTFCVSCSSSYMNVTQVYKNITKLVKKTCEKALANNNDYNRNLNYYSTIQETWDNAKCESDSCLSILNDFKNSIAAIEECESRNPPKDEQSTFCVSCSSSYMNVTQVYKNITKLVKKTCEKALANNNDYNRNLNYYSTIQETWDNAKCESDSCLSILNDFKNSIAAIEECESRNPPKDEQSTFCVSCSSSYMNVTQVYKNITKLVKKTCEKALANNNDYNRNLNYYSTIQETWDNAKCESDHCLNILTDFGYSLAAIEECESRNPPKEEQSTFCVSCSSSYMNVTQVYKNITKLVKKTCEKALANNNDYNRRLNYYSTIQETWDNAKCESDSCLSILNDFKNSIAAIEECESRNPPKDEQSTFCVSCSSSYMNVTQVYKNITKLVKKTCEKALANNNDYNRNLNYYSTIQETWDNAKCESDLCLNILTDFGYSLAAIEECESRNPPKDEQSTFCVSCSSSYMNVTQVYKNITKLVKKTCEKALANNNDYNRNLNYYSTIQETWDNAKCESDHCLNILTDFGYSLAAIEECESRNPPKEEQSTFCVSCSSSYMNVTQVYKNITKLVKKTCEKALANNNDYNRRLNYYSTIQETWDNAKCESDSCLSILNDFKNSIAAIEECESRNPPKDEQSTFCVSCSSSYMNVTQVYKNITKLVKKTCEKALANNNDYNRNLNYYSTIQETWDNAKCESDLCLNILTDFGYSLAAIEECESRNPPKDEQSTFCVSCSSSYMNVTQVYKNITKLVKKTCEKALANNNDYNRNLNYYSTIQETWDNAKCESDSCLSILNDFKNSIAAIEECESRNPPKDEQSTFCVSCSSSYMNVTQVYKNITKLVKKTCEKALANNNDYNRNLNYYSTIQETWDNAKCESDLCLNILTDFGYSLAAIEECESRNPPKDEQSTFCVSCSSSYMNVTQVYKNITKLVKKTCEKALANNNDYNRNLNYYSTIQETWDNAKCESDHCLNILTDFGYSLAAIEECESRNPPKEEQSTFCVSCSSSYMNVTQVYKNITKLVKKTCEKALANNNDYNRRLNYYSTIQETWDNAKCESDSCLNILNDFKNSIAAIEECESRNPPKDEQSTFCVSCSSSYMNVTQVYKNITKLVKKTCEKALANNNDYNRNLNYYSTIQETWDNAKCESDSCLSILNDFKNSIAAIEECESRNPPKDEQSTFCVSCSSSYMNVTQVYKNITKLVKKTCEKALANNNDYNRNLNYYSTIQETWDNAKCESDSCLSILNDFKNSIAAIEECESRNPPKDEQSTFCVSCSSSYMNVTQVYKNITKLVKKTCEKALANNNDYNRNLNYYSTIQETWDNAKCESDLCLNILNDFGYSLAAIEECESRNPPKDEQSTFCVSCSSSYMNVTQVYKNITKLVKKTCEKALANNNDYNRNLNYYSTIQETWDNAKCESDSCLSILNDFKNSIAAIEECESRNPPKDEQSTFCVSCSSSYMNVTQVYKNITKLVNKTCEKALANNNEYLRRLNYYSTIQETWDNAKCESDSCLSILNDFKNSIAAIEECESRNPPKDEQSTFCVSCSSSYMNVTQVYKNITKLVKKTCEKALANNNDYNRRLNYYSTIQETWDNAKCESDLCLNLLNDFGLSIAAFNKCVSSVPPKDEESTFCVSCSSSYWDVTEVYNDIKKKTPETPEQKSCEHELANNDNYLRDLKEYVTIQKSWKKAMCDNDSCVKMWEDFVNYIVAFENCEQEQDAILPNGPINFCLPCVSFYSNVTEVYSNIMKQETPESKTCKSNLAKSYVFLQDVKEYESIQSLWEKAKCDNCYVIHNGIHVQKDSVNNIEDAFSFYGTCVSEHRNATAKPDLMVCEKCVDAYQKVNDIYTDIEEWCAGVPYKMELMRDQWHNELGCSEPQKKSAMKGQMIALSVVGIVILLLISSAMVYSFIKRRRSTPVIESDVRPLLVEDM